MSTGGMPPLTQRMAQALWALPSPGFIAPR